MTIESSSEFVGARFIVPEPEVEEPTQKLVRVRFVAPEQENGKQAVSGTRPYQDTINRVSTKDLSVIVPTRNEHANV